MRVPLEPTCTYLRAAGEGGVVEDGCRRRARLADMEGGIPDRGSFWAQLALQGGGIEDRFDIRAIMRH